MRLATSLGPLAVAALVAGGARVLPAQSAPPVDSAPAVRWNVFARQLLLRESTAPTQTARVAQQGSTLPRGASAPTASPMSSIRVARAIALLAAAQYEAVESGASSGFSSRATIAAAAGAVLTRLRPQDSTTLAKSAARELAAARGAGDSEESVQGGARLGRAIADSLLRWAGSDDTLVRWSGAPPTGPGIWRSANGETPSDAALLVQRPWSLVTVDQFRPGPPPPFGSRDFIAALDEVRRYALAPSPDQRRVVQQWIGRVPADEWNRIAVDAIVRHRVPDDRALHVLAMVGIATADALLACADARYHYWLLRPAQADSSIPLAEGVTAPNEPSYPSRLACGAGALVTVLARLVPESREEMAGLEHEAALAGLYAGVQYRFDIETGLALGRTIARWVLDQDTRGALRGRWR